MADLEYSSHLPGVVVPIDDDAMEIPSQGVTSLMIACYRGDVQKIGAILNERRQSLHTKNHFNAKALDYAVDNNQQLIIDRLLGYGADLDELDQMGQTLLHRCVLSKMPKKVETCLWIGANLDLRNSNGETALHLAVQIGNVEVVSLLVRNSCDLNARNKDGFTPQELAFLNGSLDIQERLITPVYDNGFVSEQFFEACFEDNAELIETMIAQCGEGIVDVKHNEHKEVTPLFLVSQKGFSQCVMTLCRYGANVNHVTDSGDTPLITAVVNEQVEAVHTLVQEGARINYRNVLGRTSLVCAVIQETLPIVKILVEKGALLNLNASNGSSPLSIAVEKENLEITKYLVECGAFVNHIDTDGVTPLMNAVSTGNMSIVTYLVQHGADINRMDYMQRNALMFAVHGHDIAIVKFLVDHGADIQAMTPTGTSIAGLALSTGNAEMYQYLLNTISGNNSTSNADTLQQRLFSMVGSQNGTHEELRNIISQGADVDKKDKNGKTPLIAAIANLNNEFVEWLIDEHVNVNLADDDGRPPLIHAVLVNSILLTDRLLHSIGKYQAIFGDQSLNRTLDVNATDSEGRTALICLAEGEHSNMKQLAIKLIQFGADVNVISKQQCVLEKAVHYNKPELFDLLLQNGARLEHLCPAILIDICIAHSNMQMIHTTVGYLKNDDETFEANIYTFLKFAVANRNHIWFNAGVDAMSNAWQILKTTGEYGDSHLLLPVDPQKRIIQNINASSFLTCAASGYMMDALEFFLKVGAGSSMKIHNSQAEVLLSLQHGDYEVAAEISADSVVILCDETQKIDALGNAMAIQTLGDMFTKDRVLRKAIQESQSLWTECSSKVYDSMKSKLTRTYHTISCMSKENSTLHIHPLETDYSTMQCLADIPYKNILRIKEHANLQKARLLINASHNSSNDETLHSMQSLESQVLPGSIRRETEVVTPNCLIGCIACVFSHPKSGSFWAVTMASSIDITCAEGSSAGCHLPMLSNTDTLKLCHQKRVVKVQNLVALELEDIKPLRTYNFCLDSHVFSGKNSSLHKRQVVKTGGLSPSNSEGIIIDVNVLYQDENNVFHQDAFIVASKSWRDSTERSSLTEEKEAAFAGPGDFGAVVLDKESSIILGLVVASYQQYKNKYNHVTLCERLDNGIRSISQYCGFRIGKFRIFEEQ